jgi:hypothetical protein
MSIVTGSNHIRMVCQLLSDEPLKDFKSQTANCNEASNAVATVQVFSSDACAKQKKHLRQGMWKAKALIICVECTRICELNAQLLNFPNQTGVLPEDELESAFINICAPDWQQEFLKTGRNECGSTWDEIITRVEALENAEDAVAELKATANEKRSLEEGEAAPAAQPSLKTKSRRTFFCKLHGANHQRHNVDNCKVLLGQQISKLKEERGRPCSLC